ncbi:MAG TPA: class I SAM-dependent methyltransferase [Kofleriaceae bacterium]|jgi:SAM-dependent methyltransferase
MTYVLIVLTLLLVLDTVRMRGRLSKLAVLPAASGTDVAGFRVIARPGVTVSDETRRAAIAYARAQGLGVVDLVPRDLPAIAAMSFAQLVEPATYRKDRFGPGRTADHALVVSTDVAERARVEDPVDELAFVHLAIRLKQYGNADFAVAPAERAVAPDIRQRAGVLRALMGPSTGMALAVQPIFWVLMGLGVWLQPLYGLITLGVWHAQPILSVAGTKLRSRDLLVATLLRAPIELYLLLRTGFGSTPASQDLAAKAKPVYDELIAGGTARFFEPRRETCPVCASKDLTVFSRAADMFQHKPGRFTLETCSACGHIFQNPRLSLAGLDYYYKDFYDGLGEAALEFIFGFGAEPYHQRARMVRDNAKTPPARWLDVGGGHGHFACAARDDLPTTQFDGLDLSESIDEAKRRGWIQEAYRGLFPEIAPTIAGTYDAVSMSHYLEHTLDPRQEIAAAHTALAPGGSLMIEVPDPEFRLGRMLGRLWLPWFQPQHLNLLSVKNLERLLREAGFEPVEWHRGKAHQRVDLLFAAWLLLDRIAPSTKLPWRWRGGGARVFRGVVWTVGSPLIVLGLLGDRVLDPFFSRAKISNTYRVVARRA